jgi:thymidylate synthase (FAD)
MTKQSEVLENPKYIPVLDHGFVGLVNHMGDDHAVVQAARVSYGDGTKSIRQDRGLIRYLMRHRHTSPFEMCEVKLHIKLPIFVMRQWIRHRTASINETSGRYSVMSDEFYIPELEQIKPQSSNNKQGRGGDIDPEYAKTVRELITSQSEDAYRAYTVLLGNDKNDTTIHGDFPGIARELARMVLPVNYYTEVYWKQNLHNLFHLIKLRLDTHAQWEIRQFAQAVYDIIKPLFPACVEAFDDYVMEASSFSKQEKQLLLSIFESNNITADLFRGNKSQYSAEFGISESEIDELISKLWK